MWRQRELQGRMSGFEGGDNETTGQALKGKRDRVKMRAAGGGSYRGGW